MTTFWHGLGLQQVPQWLLRLFQDCKVVLQQLTQPLNCLALQQPPGNLTVTLFLAQPS